MYPFAFQFAHFRLIVYGYVYRYAVYVYDSLKLIKPCQSSVPVHVHVSLRIPVPIPDFLSRLT